jgi:signal transduction histidine kinase
MSIIQTALLFLLVMPFVLAIWMAFCNRWRASERASAISADAAYYNLEVGHATVGLAAAVLDAAGQLGRLAQAHGVKLELAVDPEMTVDGNANVLGLVLRETLTAAIRAVPGGRVLVTAENLGGQPNIRISDDGLGNDRHLRESLLREAGALIALQGGSVVSHATPGQGTTVTLRLPIPWAGKREIDGLMRPGVLAEEAV